MKLMNQGFLIFMLKSSLRKLCDRHRDLVNRDGIIVLHMTIYRNYNQVLFSFMFMTYHRVYIKSNTTGATFGAPEFASSFELYLWGLCDHVVKLHLFTFLVSCCDVRYA